MKKSTTFLSAVALAATAALALGACAGSSTASSTSSDSGSSATVTTLKIGASPVPQAQILEFVQKNLAADAGLKLEITTYDDYVQPNVALSEGDLDANYFQHEPYYNAQVAEKGYKFAHFAGIHIEPYALYSKKVKDIKDLAEGATIGVPNDPSNQARALGLLVKADLITLKDTGDKDATVLDVATNPKKLKFTEADAAQLPRSLDDVDAAIINGNYALEAGLSPATDSLLLESGDNNPYANFLAVRAEDKDKPALVKLDGLLHSPEVKAYIEKTWPKGEVLAAF